MSGFWHRWSRQGIARTAGIILSVLALVPGCDLPGKPRLADKPIATDKVIDFGKLYAQHCAGCHGFDGKLGPAPPLNDPVFLAIVPDSVLFGVIRGGRSGTPMPALRKLMAAH